MSQAVSRGQALQVAARVGTQVNWDALDGDVLQREVIDLSPEEFGKRFTEFLQNGARVVVMIFSAVLSLVGITFNPAKFIGAGWAIWKGAADGAGLEGEEFQDVRALAMTELDAAKMQFAICLKADESSINGEEKLKRLLALGKPLLSAKQFLALWQDYQKNKERSVLEGLFKEQGIAYLDFFGTILRSPNCSRCVLYLGRRHGQWRWNYFWLDSGWSADRASAVLAS